jgi:pyruvate/2-oxoglutarate dehydrogenase complex dihydrolipoamide acyltransferase (E2) component
MSRFVFKLPDLGEGTVDAEIVSWCVQPGEDIAEDQPLVEMMTEKATVEVPAPVSGRVVSLTGKPGDRIPVGSELVVFETDVAAAATSPTSREAALPTGHTTAPRDTAPRDTAPRETATRETATAMPARGAPDAAARAAAPNGRVLTSPAIRRRAHEAGIDLKAVPGTGPNGRISRADLQAYLDERSAAPQRRVAASAAPAAVTVVPPSAEVTEIKVIGLRRVIAERMSESARTIPHFSYVEEVDVTELVRLRDRMAKHVEKHGVKLSYLPFLVKGVIAGLRAHPWMNATMDDAAGELVVHRDYNIGIATAAPEGLLVPVVRNADRKSVAQLAKEIQELAERARAGKATLADLSGGTFTITSLGALGGVLATPILNYPEVSILGVHRIVKRPVYNGEGAVVPAQLMNLSVSLDHRVLDGIVGAQFLAVVKSYLEDPHQLFAELA